MVCLNQLRHIEWRQGSKCPTWSRWADLVWPPGPWIQLCLNTLLCIRPLQACKPGQSHRFRSWGFPFDRSRKCSSALNHDEQCHSRGSLLDHGRFRWKFCKHALRAACRRQCRSDSEEDRYQERVLSRGRFYPSMWILQRSTPPSEISGTKALHVLRWFDCLSRPARTYCYLLIWWRRAYLRSCGRRVKLGCSCLRQSNPRFHTGQADSRNLAPNE